MFLHFGFQMGAPTLRASRWHHATNIPFLNFLHHFPHPLWCFQERCSSLTALRCVFLWGQTELWPLPEGIPEVRAIVMGHLPIPTHSGVPFASPVLFNFAFLLFMILVHCSPTIITSMLYFLPHVPLCVCRRDNEVPSCLQGSPQEQSIMSLTDTLLSIIPR